MIKLLKSATPIKNVLVSFSLPANPELDKTYVDKDKNMLVHGILLEIFLYTKVIINQQREWEVLNIK